MIKNTITNAADITVLNLIDRTYKTGGGPVSVAGTVVVASRGPVGRAVQVRNENWEAIFGKPLPRSYGEGFEGLRHVGEAAENCQYLQVVRVVANDYRYPSITINDDGTTTTGAHAHGTVIVPAAGALMSIFIKDGDPSTDRKIEIGNIDPVKNRFTVTLYGKDAANEDVAIERYTVSFDENARDDMGAPAFIESVLDQRSERLGVVLADSPDIADLQTVAPIAFTGGTNGSEPTTTDWVAAWDLFRDDRVFVNMLFAAGNYDTVVLGNIAEIAKGRYTQWFFDCPPYLKHDDAIAWLKDAGIQGRQGVAVYGAYSATDPYYGGSTVWGFSGAAAGARATANANFVNSLPGVWFTVAGVKRGTINRRSVKALFTDDILNKDDLYEARINPVLPNESGVGIYIGDSLALHFEQNYSRFEWITSLDNYITHRFVEGAGYAKFEPDGLTAEILNDIMTGILDPLVTAGAIVRPRNPEVDGTAPYRLRIYQQEIDLWMVEWDYCPVGAARRIVGQPMLIR